MQNNKMYAQPAAQQPGVTGGVPVRTNLHAGLSWEELEQQLGSLWEQVSATVSGAVSSLGNNGSSSTPTA
ncbi:MAG: hypothetical protein ACKO4U_09130 [Caldilinea sp.]